MSEASDIETVRSFNRLVTRQVGALQDRYLGGRPLGETRVLFEIGERGATPRDVRARLGLDSGYVSRMVRALERDGLVRGSPDPADRRTQRLELTARGLAEMRRLDRISDEVAAGVLEPLDGDQRSRLLAAQSEVRHLLAISMTSFEVVDPGSPDARWCLGHYFAELAERFEESFDPSLGAPEDRDVYRPPSGAFAVVRFGGQPAGCGALMALEAGVGEIKRMWIDRPHRGLGIARRLLGVLEDQASELGFERVRLDTNRSLAEAQAMYRSSGYAAIERYNDNPYANHWFEKRLGVSLDSGTAKRSTT